MRSELERAIKLYVKIYHHLISHAGEKPIDPRDAPQAKMVLDEIERIANMLD